MDRWPAEVVAQLAEHLAGRRPLVGDDEDEVAGLGADLLADTAADSSAPRNFATGESNVAVVGDLQPDEALGAERLGPVGQLVELVAADSRRPRRARRIALMAAAPAKALNSVAANTSVSSTSSMPKRRSGLSTP